MPSLGRVALRFFQTSALVVFILSGFSWFNLPVLASPLPVPSLTMATSNNQLAARTLMIVDYFPRAILAHDVNYESPHKSEKRDGGDKASSLEEYRQRFSNHRDTMSEYFPKAGSSFLRILQGT